MRPEHRRPEIIGAEWLASLFFELSTCRSVGMGGLGPIPATAIWHAEDRFALPGWVGAAIHSIDAAYLARHRKAAPGDGEA